MPRVWNRLLTLLGSTSGTTPAGDGGGGTNGLVAGDGGDRHVG